MARDLKDCVEVHKLQLSLTGIAPAAEALPRWLLRRGGRPAGPYPMAPATPRSADRVRA